MADVQLTGERIAYHRKRLGLSQFEFAALIGRSDSWLSQSSAVYGQSTGCPYCTKLPTCSACP